jgi:hypothetical protein
LADVRRRDRDVGIGDGIKDSARARVGESRQGDDAGRAFVTRRVRRAIRTPEADTKYRREVQPLPKLRPFQIRLDALLEEDEARLRREKLRITRVHHLLLREGSDGSYDAAATLPAGGRLGVAT